MDWVKSISVKPDRGAEVLNSHAEVFGDWYPKENPMLQLTGFLDAFLNSLVALFFSIILGFVTGDPSLILR